MPNLTPHPQLVSYPLLPSRLRSRGGSVVLFAQVCVPRDAPSGGVLVLLVLVCGFLGFSTVIAARGLRRGCRAFKNQNKFSRRVVLYFGHRGEASAVREVRGVTRSAGRRHILAEGYWKRLVLPLAAPGVTAVGSETVRETHFLHPEVVEDVYPGRRCRGWRHVGYRRCRCSVSALERDRCSRFLERNTVLAQRCSSLVLECS